MCHNIQNMLEEARENSSSDLSHIHIALVPRQEEYDITQCTYVIDPAFDQSTPRTPLDQ